MNVTAKPSVSRPVIVQSAKRRAERAASTELFVVVLGWRSNV